MAADPHSPGRAVPLRGRGGEVRLLADLVTAVRAGQSRVLVVRGEPGVGKTALLDYLAGQAAGCRVVRVAGVQSEMEVAFAGLHQLLAPMLDRVERLPAPQREALRTVFGISAGPAPDRFLVALAVLSLLSEVAAERPLLCVVDDQQWLDQESAQALGFAARRLAADPVGLVFAAWVPGEELAGLPELAVAGLAETDARALLDSALAGPLDARVRDQIVAEAGGNPLALLELPRGMTPAELAGGFGLPGALSGQVSLTGRIEDSFRRRLDALPTQTRQLLLLAAADPSGDPSLVWQAAGRLGLPVRTAVPAVDAGLAEFRSRIIFRHPLVRSAIYRSASFKERQEVHRALAEATDPQVDPDRRAWHRAQAADGPDEEVAAELERSAGRAQTRGGLAAAAAFLERSVRLTADPARLVDRTLAAAQTSMQAGAFDKALGLLVITEAWPLDEFALARVDLLRGQTAFASGLSSAAPPLLLSAARRLEPLDSELARETYLDAWGAAFTAGQPAAGDMAEICRAARALPRSSHPGPVELLLDGLALYITDGLPAAAPVLAQAVSLFAGDSVSAGDRLRWSYMTLFPPVLLWDDDGYRAIIARQTQLVRNAGALARLPLELASGGVAAAWSGDFEGAAALIAEAEAVCAATGSRVPAYAALVLACLRGSQAEAVPLIDAMINAAEAGGQGIAETYARWAATIFYNGLGRYEQAQREAEQATGAPAGHYVSAWALPELIEAAARSGNSQLAAGALERLAEMTQAGGNDWGLGIEARSRALVTADGAAEGWYREAIDRLGRTQRRTDVARAHLLYGEWLRRQGHRSQARGQLRTALAMLDQIGMRAFAERARRELEATGETARKRTAQPAARESTAQPAARQPAAQPGAREHTTQPAARPAGRKRTAGAGQELTAQETQVAQLARDGLSNPEIAARLFISSHTVQYHLGKVFTKLGITSRGQLHRALPGGPGASGR
jgi:DNA-binding CsgD family transcriptional regulator